MKSRKMLLQALLSIALVFSLILPASVGASVTVPLPDDSFIIPSAVDSSSAASAMALNTPRGNVTPMVAAGGSHTVGLKSDGTVVAVGSNYYGQCDVSGWNLVLALPSSQCALTTSSTTGGSVTTPGEGTFTYDEGTVVDLVAEAEEGYRFVNWIGNVSTIADVTATVTNITMDDSYSITANFEYESQEGQVGIKAGDWIKVAYKITGWPAGQPYPEWVKAEFLSVEGTIANVQVMLHISDGTEQSDTMPVDVVAGGGEAFGLSGFIISANLTTGDSVYITGYGDVAIEGETTRTYAGARRTVVYVSISQSIPYQGEVQLTYYWDKLTGVVVEASTTSAGTTATAKATETNMWEAAPPAVGMAWWLWVIIAVAIVAVAFAVYRLKKRKTPTTPPPPTEGT
jgi:hypothetical protein